MLHMIRNGHDAHHEHLVRTSAATVELTRDDGKFHLLLAASGKSSEIVQIINGLAAHKNLSIRVILTQAASHFLAGQTRDQPTLSSVSAMPNVDAVYTDSSEWGKPWKRGAPILHISLRRWADLMVIAPLSANTMAKMVHGMCDNLLTSTIRAWDATGAVDGTKKKIVVCPGMDMAMYRHPLTAKSLKTLQEEWGGDGGWVEVLTPVEKSDGALVEWEKIVEAIETKMAGKKLSVGGK